MHVDIFCTLLCNSGLESYLAVIWRIVMAHKESRFSSQVQNLASRCIEGARISARKVATRCSNVWHEHGVAYKDGIAKLVSHAGGGMAWDK